MLARALHLDDERGGGARPFSQCRQNLTCEFFFSSAADGASNLGTRIYGYRLCPPPSPSQHRRPLRALDVVRFAYWRVRARAS